MAASIHPHPKKTTPTNRSRSSTSDRAFRARILRYWRTHGRHDLPWRKNSNPYRILVSEIMLQQTQVARAIPKYQEFTKKFPTFRALARASTVEVLTVWQGLGYNRRALMLQRCAQVVMRDHRGTLPDDFDTLRSLPGLGSYTAGAILAFAFNKPHPMIETNIRRTYLHHYFPNKKSVPDATLVPIIERTMDRKNPRRWFGALMDYGSYLATQTSNPNIRSAHYTRQSKFEGSVRQLRGQVLRAFLKGDSEQMPRDPRVPNILAALKREGLVV